MMQHKQQGLSLIELMISITLGLIVMAGVIQMFISSRAVFSTQQGVSRVQESGRMAAEFMARDIRMAGFMGCMSRNMNITNILNDSDDLLYNFAVAIEGVTAPAPIDSGYPDALDGTDILVLRSASGEGVEVVSNKLSADLMIGNTGNESGSCPGGTDRISGFCQHDIVVVTDCEKSRVFQLTSLTEVAGGRVTVGRGSGGSPGNAVSTWGGPTDGPETQFGDAAEVIKVSTIAYYIAPSDSGRPALWQSVNGEAQELLEGVEDMRLTYGVPTTPGGIPDDYRVASAVTDWSRVASVRAQLLVQSTDDGVLADPQPYTFGGETVADPGDRRLRQVFTKTIAIRSRLP